MLTIGSIWLMRLSRAGSTDGAATQSVMLAVKERRLTVMAIWERHERRLALALQGSFGAFTWGVLDRVLEDGLTIEAISGASAGAVNAVLLASGLQRDGRTGARQALAG